MRHMKKTGESRYTLYSKYNNLEQAGKRMKTRPTREVPYIAQASKEYEKMVRKAKEGK